jgi:hypothetical protein
VEAEYSSVENLFFSHFLSAELKGGAEMRADVSLGDSQSHGIQALRGLHLLNYEVNENIIEEASPPTWCGYLATALSHQDRRDLRDNGFSLPPLLLSS